MRGPSRRESSISLERVRRNPRRMSEEVVEGSYEVVNMSDRGLSVVARAV